MAEAEAEAEHQRCVVEGGQPEAAPCKGLSHLRLPCVPTWPASNSFSLALGTAKLFLIGSLSHGPVPLRARVVQLDMVTSVRQNGA